MVTASAVSFGACICSPVYLESGFVPSHFSSDVLGEKGMRLQ